jgi:hypothetical protein
MSQNELADRYAALKIEMDALQDELDAVKSMILATGVDVIEGDRFRVTVGLQERTSISAKEAEKVLDPSVYQQLAKTTMFSAVRYKAIKA